MRLPLVFQPSGQGTGGRRGLLSQLQLRQRSFMQARAVRCFG